MREVRTDTADLMKEEASENRRLSCAGKVEYQYSHPDSGKSSGMASKRKTPTRNGDVCHTLLFRSTHKRHACAPPQLKKKKIEKKDFIFFLVFFFRS